MTEYIIYEDTAGNSMEFPTKNPSCTIAMLGKEVVRQVNKVGITVDPNQVYRVFTCTANLTSTEYDILKGWLMPASVAEDRYGVYPRMKFYLDSTTYWDDPDWIKCVIVGEVVGHILSDGKWAVGITLVERSD